MSEERLAVFFCSSYFGIDEKYNAIAHDVVKAACEKGYGVVSGGSYKGTMNVVCETAHECGVTNKGILPKYMEGLEYPYLTELRWTETMAQRKEAMREGTSLAVALPGGLGTLDELAETLTLLKLNRYSGKIIVMNYDGFYEPFKALLQHYIDIKMLEPGFLEKISFPRTIEEFKELI